MKVIIALFTLGLLTSCGSITDLGKTALSGVADGVSNAKTITAAKDIGKGESPSSWTNKRVVPYKKHIDKFVTSFKDNSRFTASKSMDGTKCAYYGSNGKRNSASLMMGGTLPQVFAKCHINNKYVEIYTYNPKPVPFKKGVKLTQMQKAQKFFDRNKYPSDKYAIKNNMVIVFDKTDEGTKQIRSKFLAGNF